MKIAICDKERKDAELLLNYCKTCKLPYEVTIFLSASEFLCEFSLNFYDVIFLDIEMEHLNGYEVVAELVKMNTRPLIIFTAYSSKYMNQGYGIAAHYLLKPITLSKFQQVFGEVLSYLLPKKIILSYNGMQKVISVNDIVYFESLSHHIIFHLKENKCFECKDTMKHMLDALPHPNFLQVHRSFCINLLYIDNIKSSLVTMVDGVQIPVSRKKQGELQERFLNLLKDNQR